MFDLKYCKVFLSMVILDKERRRMNKRKFLRFAVPLRIELSGENIRGFTKDFSREGLKAVFNHFPFDASSHIKFKVQKPNEDVYIPVSGEVMWKKVAEKRCEVGIRLRNFPPGLKAKILEHGYHAWVKDKKSYRT